MWYFYATHYKADNVERVNTFINLLSQINNRLSSLITLYKRLKSLQGNKSNSEHKNLGYKIVCFKDKIKDLFVKLNKFFNEGFFQKITKEQADEISDEYQYLVESIIHIKIQITKDSAWKKFTELINDYENIIMPFFETINKNIEVYNKKADSEGWKYKLRTIDEAIDYYNQNFKIIPKNFFMTKNENNQNIAFKVLVIFYICLKSLNVLQLYKIA